MYEQFYRLTGKPFQLNPDPAFYFGSRGHKRAFAYLQYGLYQGEGFIVITGEIGAGKTTLVRSLLEQIDHDKVVAAQLVSTQLDAGDLLRAVGVAFGLPVRTVEKAVILASIEAFLCQLAMESKRALLVVDEAQNLTARAVEELRMLSNFQFGDYGSLQSFLVGQPELRSMMQRSQMQQLRQRVTASYHLGPLDDQETEAYVMHRLRHVGWENDPRFTQPALELIHSESGGIPRRINTLCNRVMLAAYLGEKHVIDRADVQAVAEEMRAELGGFAASDEAGVSAGETATQPASAPGGLSHGVHAQGTKPGAGDTQLASRFRRIEDRVDRLDRTLGATVDLLHNLLHPEKAVPPGPPSAP